MGRVDQNTTWEVHKKKSIAKVAKKKKIQGVHRQTREWPMIITGFGK